MAHHVFRRPLSQLLRCKFDFGAGVRQALVKRVQLVLGVDSESDMVQADIPVSVELDEWLFPDCPESEHDVAIAYINGWILLIPLHHFPAEQGGEKICALLQLRYGKPDMVRAFCSRVVHDFLFSIHRSRSGARRGFIAQRPLHCRVGHLVSRDQLRHATSAQGHR